MTVISVRLAGVPTLRVFAGLGHLMAIALLCWAGRPGRLSIAHGTKPACFIPAVQRALAPSKLALLHCVLDSGAWCVVKQH